MTRTQTKRTNKSVPQPQSATYLISGTFTDGRNEYPIYVDNAENLPPRKRKCSHGHATHPNQGTEHELCPATPPGQVIDHVPCPGAPGP